MKFVLILIAAILVFLGIYTYSYQTTEKSAPIPKTFEKKVEAQETEKVSVVTQEVKEKKSSVKNIAVKSPKVVSQEVSPEMEEVLPSATMDDDKLEIDEEYTPNVNQTSDELISDKEWNDIEKQMIKSGQISQEDDPSASTENLGYDPSELAR